jgi:putative secretion ATPase (PEP-CTERM system associated)
MYTDFYGLTGKPFQLNPDPRFYYGSRQHKRAMSFLNYGLHQGEGFIVVTGEVGAGKTTVVRNLLSALDPGKMIAANLVSTQLEADDILRMVAAAFGVRTANQDKAHVLMSLEAALAAHTSARRRCLLVIDEAQNLSHGAVEELRMLSNFQLGSHALLQSFLVGQPEFRQILQRSDMHQLRQRVIAACHIGPLEPDETRRYVEHRLACVGWRGVPRIDREAFEAIHEASGGVPRRINLLCDRVLLSGFLAGERAFTARMVRDVGQELRAETLESAPAAPVQEAAVLARTMPATAVMRERLGEAEREVRALRAGLERLERGGRMAPVDTPRAEGTQAQEGGRTDRS